MAQFSGNHRVRGVVAGGLFILGLAGLVYAETWRSNMTGGFGAADNGVISYIFSPQLTTGATGWAYLPARNTIAGAGLRRTTDFATFSALTTTGFGIPTNINFVNMIEFDNGTEKALLTGTARTGLGVAHVYRSTDGVTFSTVTPLSGTPPLHPNNKLIVGMAQMGGWLYWGTQNTVSGGEIWRSSMANAGSSWVNVSTAGFGIATNQTISYLKAWEGALYAGTIDNTNGGRIYRSINGTTWTLVADSATWAGTNNRAVAVLEDFGGALYALTNNPTDGAQIWKTSNGTSWTKVTLPGGDGFGFVSNQEFHAAQTALGNFWVGTWNGVQGAQVWRTTDVVSGPWTQSNSNGWGNANNAIAMTQGSGLFKGQLYYGSSNTAQGAEIWNVGLPKAVTNLTALAAAGTDGKIDLSWTSPDQLGAGSRFAVQYGTYVAAWSTSSAQVILSTSGVASGGNMSYQLSGLTMGSSYYAKVWTDNVLGWSPPTVSSASAVAPNLAAPLAPTGLAVQAAGQTAVSLLWTANTEADLKDYRVWRSTNAGVTLVSSNTISTPTAANFLNLNLSTNTVYYFRVTARDSANNESPGSTEVSTLTAAGLRVWDGGGSGSSATAAANWQYDIPLSSGDSVLFDGAVSTKNATWDFTGAVKDLRLENGYTGTVTASGTATVTVQGKFNVASGTFNATGSTLTVTGDFTQSGGGGLTLTNGTVKFDGTTVQTVSVLGGYPFNNFTVASSSKVKAGTTLNMDGALTVSSGEFHLRAPGDTFTGFHDFKGSATVNGGKLDVGTSSAAFRLGLTVSSGTFVMPPSGARVELGGSFNVTGGTFHVMGVNNWITSTDPGNVRYAFSLNAGSVNVTGMTLESMDVAGASVTVSLSTNIVAFDNVRYRQVAPGGAALRYNLTVGQLTFTGHDFDATASTNVYAPSLSTTVYLVMAAPSGANRGAAYENDPGNGIYWGLPPIPGGFTAAASGATSIAWSWTDGADEQGYRVKQATSNTIYLSTGPNAATWAQTGLSANTSQQMYVEAFNPVGIASSAAITKFTNAAVPTGTYVSAVTSETVTIAWSANGNPSSVSYELHRATESFFSTSTLITVSTTNGQHTGLLPNTSYYFRARAKNDDGIFSVYDSSVSTATLTEATAPAPPGSLSVGGQMDQRARLNWAANTEADLKDYRVHRSTNGNVTVGSSWTVVAATILKPGTTHLDTGLTNNTTFYYRVAARDTSLNESGLTGEVSTMPGADVSPPAVPTGLVGYSGNTKLRLNWTANTDADFQDYRIWRSTNAGVTLVSSHTLSSTTAITYLDTGLTNGTTYFYRLTARDFTGNESAGGGEVGPPVPAIGERVWDGGGTGNSVTEAANWTNDLSPDTGDSVRYNATSTKNVAVDGASPGSGLANLTMESGYTGTITVSSAQVFTGTLTQSGGTQTVSGNVNVTFRGNVTINGGTFSQTTGTVILDGGAQTINAPSAVFWNIISSGTGVKTLASNVEVDGTLTLWRALGGQFAMDLGTNTLRVAGNIQKDNGDGLTGVAGSKVALDGSGTQTVYVLNLPNTDLDVAKSSGTLDLNAGAITVNNVTHSGGTINPGSTFVHAVGGSWTATGGDITVTGTSGFNLNSSSVRTLSATGAGYKFNVLKSSGAGSIRTTSGIAVEGSLEITGSSTFEFGAGTSTVKGQAQVRGGATLLVSSAVVNFTSTVGDSVVVDSAPTPGTFRLTTANPTPLVGLAGTLTSRGTFESQAISNVIRSTSPSTFIGVLLDSGTVNVSGITFRDLHASTGVTVGSTATVTALNNVRYRNLQANTIALRWNKNANLVLTGHDFDSTVATNVYTTAVSSPNFIQMSGATGPRAGESFEGDSNNRVFWGLPATPAGVTATALSTSSIRWSWNNMADEEDIRVIRTSDNAVMTTLLVNTVSWDQIGLTPDATQQMFIRAHNPLGDANSVSFTRATLSSTPTASAVTSVTSATVNVSWGPNGNPGYTVYEAQLSTDAVFSTAAVTLSSTVTTTAAAFSALLTKTSYYFQVRSRNLDLVYSSFTAIISTRTSPETLPPVTAITVPAAGGYVTAFSTIQGTASDNLSGVATTYVQIRRNSDAYFWTGSVWAAGSTDLVTTLSGPLTSRTWTYNAGAVGVVDGADYNVYARSQDTDGNNESPSPTITVTVDQTSPTAVVTVPADAVRYNALLTLSGTSSDPTPGLTDRVEVRVKRASDGFFWNGSAFQSGAAWNTAVATNPWTYTAVPAWADGFDYAVDARAVDKAGNTSVISASKTFTFDTTAPGVVAVPAVADVAGDQGTALNLSWAANSEADLKEYRVYRSTNNLVTVGSTWTITLATIAQPGTTHQDTGLTPVTTYYYKVTARDSSLNESSASTETNLRPVDNLAPAAPSAPTAADVPADQGFALRLNWALNPETDVREYGVYRSTNGNVTAGSSWTVLMTLVLSPGTTRQDGALTNGTTYYYKVSARDTSGNESGLSPESSAYPADNAAPAAVTNLTAAQEAQVKLTWTAPADGVTTVTTYEIRYSTLGAIDTETAWSTATVVGAGLVPAPLAPGATQTATITGLKPRIAHWFAVKSRDVAGNWSVIDTSLPEPTTAAGSFTMAQEPAGAAGPSNGAAWGDYDNDGDLDLVSGGTDDGTNYRLRVYRNDAGTLNLVSEPAGATGPGSGLSWGDYDRDGDLDLAAAGPVGGGAYRLRIYRNDGGTFVQAQEPNGASAGAESVSWGDYDNDGDLDLAMGGNEGAGLYRLRVYRNDANTFNLAQEPAGATGPGQKTAWGDYDNDGDLDLAAGGYDGVGFRLRIYRNDAGTFVQAQEPGGASGPGQGLAWGDYDNDGDLDLAASGDTGGLFRFRVYRNDVGTFVQAQEPAGTDGPGWRGSVGWGDYDNDGDLDLAVNGSDSVAYRLRLYRNDAGTFNLAQEPAGTTAFGGGVAWGDYDGDGDVDLVASGFDGGTGYRLRVYRSLEAQHYAANAIPAVPGGLSFSTAPAQVTFKWAAASDAVTPANGLYYEVRASTFSTVTDTNAAQIAWRPASPFLGNYPRGYVSSSPAQLGVNYKPPSTLDNTTFYWQVRTIDSGQWVSGWSAAQTAWTNLFSPSSPTALGVVDAPSDQGTGLGLSWAANPEGDLADYRIFRSTSAGVTLVSSNVVAVVAKPGVTHQDNGLTPVTTYYYKITARDTGGNESGLSSEVNLRPVDNVAPAAPAFPPGSVTDVPADQGFALRITWGLTGDTDVREYRIYRSTNYGVTQVSSHSVTLVLSPGTTHQDAGLSNGVTHYYAVAARDTSSNESALSPQDSAIPYDNTAPGFPGAVTVSSTTGGADVGQRLSLSWSAVGDSDLKDYRVYRSTNSGVAANSSWTVLVITLSGTTKQDGGLTDGTTFYYRISARDVSLNEGNLSTEVSAAPQDSVAPSPPTGLSVVQLVGALRLDWGAVSDNALKDYRVYRSTNGNVTVGSSWTVVATTILAGGTTHQDGGLTNETTFYYRVTARDASLNESVGSPEQNGKPSNTADLVAPSSPTAPGASQPAATTNRLDLSWGASTDTGGSGLRDYRVYRSTNLGVTLVSSHVVITVLQPGTSQPDGGLTNNTTFYYRVTARDNALNESAGSVEFSGVPRDLIAPAAITNLTAATQAQILLTWTAPSDNVGVTSYLIRYSSFGPIGTEGHWSTATAVVGAAVPLPTAPGTTQTATITGLNPRTAFWFAIKSLDGQGNTSALDTSTPEPTALSGSFVLAQEPAGVSDLGTGGLAWGDYDGDGDLDLAVNGNGGSGNKFRVYRNDGGIFNLVQEPAGAIGPGDVGSVAWGDYDKDGDLDLVVIGYNGTTYKFQVYRNDGGIFNLVQEPAGATGLGNGSVSWGDFDNDGDLDLAVNGTDGTNPRFQIYRNDGGIFNLFQEPAGATGVGNGALAWGDYDNDGDLDLAVNGSDATGQRLRVYRNDGGSFVLAQEPAGTTGPGTNGALAWGDYDNDGDLDLAVLGNDGVANVFAIYRNDAGTLVSVQSLPGLTASGQKGAVAWGDFDNDGDLDLAVCGNDGTGNRFRIYRNDGGTFNLTQEPAGTTGPGHKGAVVWGDFDGDGDLDLAMSGYDGTNSKFRIYKSLEADLVAANGAPSAPASGLTTAKRLSGGVPSGVVELRWNAGVDNLPGGLTPANGLNYIVRVSTASGNYTNPAALKVAWSTATPFLGNYPHGFISSTPLQPGLLLKPAKIKTTYYWQVATVDAGLRSSGWSVEQSTMVDLEPPANPSGATAADTGSDQGGSITFYWTANTETDLRNYEVARGTWAFADSGQPSLTITQVSSGVVTQVASGLTNGTTYYFTVRAYDTEGNLSSWATQPSAVPVDNLAPAGPSGLTALTPLFVSRAVNLSWSPNADPDLKDYQLWRSTNSPAVAFSSWTVIVATIPAPGTTYQDAGLGPQISFFYVLTARDVSLNNSGATPNVTGNPAPAAPTGLGVGFWDPGRALILSWIGVPDSDLQDYRIRRATYSLAGTAAPVVGTILSAGTTHVDAGLVDGTTYYFTVLARDNILNHSASTSEVSAVPRDIVAPSSPTAFAATNANSGGAINLTWNANAESDMKEYTIYRGTATNFEAYGGQTFVASRVHPLTTHQDAGLQNGLTYYYHIHAVDNAGNTSPGSAESFAAPSSSSDATAPTAAIASPVANAYYYQLATLSGTSADTGGGTPGVDRVEVSVRNQGAGSWWNGSAFLATTEYWSPALGTATWTYAAPTLTVGTTYLVGGRARDLSGNLASPAYSTFTYTARARWLVLLPGQTAAPGTPTGRSGAPSARTAGVGFSATVYLTNTEWYTVNDASDTVTGTSSDSFDIEPPAGQMVNGQRSLAFTLVTASAAHTISASGSGYTANTSDGFAVNAGAATKLQLLLPGEAALAGSASGKSGTAATQTAGSSFTATVNLTDANWNPVTGGGMPIVQVVTGDPYDTEPAAASLVSGTKAFTVTLKTAGSPVGVTASDTGAFYASQTSTISAVNPGALSQLQVIVPGETAAPGSPTGKTGTPATQIQRSSFSATVRAVDAFWNLVSTNPMVTVTTDDGTDSEPPPAALTGGTTTFVITFQSTGTFTVTASAGGLLPNTGSGIPTVDGIAPVAVGDLAAATPASPEGAVTLTWTAPGDDGTIGTATIYRVRHTTGSGNFVTAVNWPTATSYFPGIVPVAYGTPQSLTVTGLTPGTTFYFAVRAEDEAGNLATLSNSPAAPAQNVTPAAPSGLTATDAPLDQGGAVRLNWTANTEIDIQVYRVYRSTNAGVVVGSTWTVLLASVAAPGTTHLDSGLANGATATYFYRIAARDFTGNVSSLSSEQGQAPSDNLAPAIPTGFGAQDASTGSTLNLSWMANPDPDIKDYRIYRTIFGGALTPLVSTNVVALVASPGTTYQDAGLVNGTLYYYRLTARDISLQESGGSALVSATPSIVDTTPPATITNLSALTGSGEGGVSLTWTAPSDNVGVVSYRLRGSRTPIVTQADFNAAAYQQTLVTPLSPGTTESRTAVVTAGVTWYFAVEAVDAAGNVAALPTVAVAVSSNPNAPNAPAGLAVADARLGGKVNLSWTANTEADMGLYAVWRGTYGGFPDSKGVFLASVTHPTAGYADANLVNGSTYFYHVYAIDLGGLRNPLPAEASGMPTGAASLSVTGLPSPYTAGARTDIVVAARAGDGSLSASYTGTVRFTSTDGSALLPGLYTFTSGYADADKGLHIFKAGVILNTEGAQSVMVEDVANPSVAGKQTVTVIALGAISGKVTRGASGQAITGVLVTARSIETGAEFSATSLIDGTYEIKSLNKGRYKLTASWSEGGVTASVWLEAAAGEKDRNFTLQTKNDLGGVQGSVGSLVSASAKAGTARVAGLSPALAAQALADDPTLPKVEVKLPDGRVVATVPVNPSGRFEVPNLLTESYEVRAWTGGAWSEPKRVSVLAGQTLAVDFEALGFVPNLAVVGPNPSVNGQAPSLWFYADWPSWDAKVAILDAAGAPVYGGGIVIEREAGRAMAPARAFTHRAVWSGANTEGRSVASGVYLLRLEVTNPETGETRSVVRKALVIR